jgi:hypothetical protein
VLVPHLHLDHVSASSQWPQATFVVDRAERAAADRQRVPGPYAKPHLATIETWRQGDFTGPEARGVRELQPDRRRLRRRTGAAGFATRALPRSPVGAAAAARPIRTDSRPRHDVDARAAGAGNRRHRRGPGQLRPLRRRDSGVHASASRHAGDPESRQHALGAARPTYE